MSVKMANQLGVKQRGIRVCTLSQVAECPEEDSDCRAIDDE